MRIKVKGGSAWVGFCSLAGCACGAARIGILGMIFGDYGARPGDLVMAGKQAGRLLIEALHCTYCTLLYSYCK